MKRTLPTAVIMLAALVALGVLIIGTEACNVAADEPHTSLVVTTLTEHAHHGS